VGIQQGQAGGLHPLHHAGFTLATLVEVEGRSVDDAQHLGTGCLGGLGGLVEPGVFADQQAEAAAAGGEHHRALACIPARDEIAPLVKHLVVGQLALAVGGHHLATGQHRRGIEALHHRV